MLHSLHMKAFDGPILSTSEDLLAYLRTELAYAQVEQFRVLYLNTANRLLRDARLAVGSVSETIIYPREVVRQALEVGATALILIHNHPSGDPSPSRSDLQATRQLKKAALLFDLRIHDHLIIARSGSCSLRMLGLL